VTTQDRRDSPGRHAELGADPVLPTPLLPTQRQHALLNLERGASGTSARTRGPVKQTGLTLGPEPGNPAVRALAGDTKLFRNVGDRSTVLDNPSYEQTATMQIETGISVGHEDLLVGEDVRHLH
jgi:hypothetical protein